MEYRKLGHSGLSVSIVGLGTNQFGGRCDREQTAAIVHRALDLGVTCIDTSDTYPPGPPSGRSEEFIGAALQGRRHDVVLATKFASPMGEGPFWSGGSRRYIRNAVEASLRRLNTDYIDLYQMHRPDPSTPIEETLGALDDLVHAGLVRYVGCSNFSAWQICEASWVAKTEHLTPFISAQNQYNLLDRTVEPEILPACGRYGLGMLPFYPLASGFLTGKYRQGEDAPEGTRLASGGRMAERTLTEGNFALLQRLEKFTQDAGHTTLELAMAWLAAQPTVGSVIAGVTSPEQVEANVSAAEWKMTPAEVAEVSAIAKPV
jgi:aryl-alcohol dehydrogenase-like predicted oxidoreductase